MTGDVYCVGIDPGSSAGLSVFWNSTQILVTQGEPDIVLGTLSSCLSTLDRSACVFVGVERYVTGGSGTRRTHQPEAQNMIGRVAQLLVAYPSIVFELQSPTDAHRVLTAAQLRAMGLWCTGRQLKLPDADDANMATRHALLCMLRHSPRTFRALLTEARVPQRLADSDNVC